MSNKSTLMLLVFMTLASGGFRWMMQMQHSDYDSGLSRHKNTYKDIRSMVDDLRDRRKQVILGDAQEFILGYLNEQAGRVHIGQVNAPEKESRKNNYTDFNFVVEFEKGKESMSRQALAGFMFNVESQKRTMRMRTTGLKMRPDTGDRRMSKGVAKGGDRDDIWRVDNLAFTRRLPRDKD